MLFTFYHITKNIHFKEPQKLVSWGNELRCLGATHWQSTSMASTAAPQ